MRLCSIVAGQEQWNGESRILAVEWGDWVTGVFGECGAGGGTEGGFLRVIYTTGLCFHHITLVMATLVLKTYPTPGPVRQFSSSPTGSFLCVSMHIYTTLPPSRKFNPGR